ncbi:MAG: hypothetical protein H7831_12320 [Magnetococcus sp. WYHC-3]
MMDIIQNKETIVLKKGLASENWWEEATLAKLKKNPPPWGREQIIPFENKEAFKVRITKEMLADYDPHTNPQGRNIWKSFKKYEEIGPLAFAGIRHVMNIENIHDTRQVKNTFERFLTSLSLGLMIKIMYNKGADYAYQMNYGHEVRYNSDFLQDVALRTLSAIGFVCHCPHRNSPTAIWNTSTMGKFFCFPLSLCGTASHAESEVDGLKLIDYEGSQFLISSIEAMIAVQRAILEKIEKDGYLDFSFPATDNPRITSAIYENTNGGMHVYRKYQEKTAADDYVLDLIKSLDPASVHIDCAHGSAYRTLESFMGEMGLVDLAKKLDWIHRQERPDFGNIGKLKENPKTEKEEIFDLGADGTQLYEKVAGDKIIKYFPVLLTADYPEIFANLPVGDVILHTDMDNDRLYVSQVLANTQENKDLLAKIGVIYNVINDEKIDAVFIPNKFFHFLHEMNFERLQKLSEQGKIEKDRTLVVLKTVASTSAIDQWAAQRKKRGHKIEVVNTPVGFAKLANIMYRMEGEMRKNPGQDIIILDARGNQINVGPKPLILAAWEESGGIIVGITYGYKDLLGNEFLAMREKSATESIFLSLALFAKLQKEKGKINLAEYLKELYERDKIDTPIDLRFDNKLFVPSASGGGEEEQGNKRKYRIFGAYVSLALAYKHGQITIETARKILRDIFNEEFEARQKNVKFTFKEAFMSRFRDIDLDSLCALGFTGDSVEFLFEKGPDKWFVMSRPSGTEPKLRAYGFGNNQRRLEVDTWVVSMTENVAGILPKSFTSNQDLMELWGDDGVKAVDKARRMHSAWEDYGLLVDTKEDKRDLESRKLVRNFTPPDGHLDLINGWLKDAGLKEINLKSDEPKTMSQEAVVELLEAVPDAVYKKLGRTKKEVIEKDKNGGYSG